MHGNQNFARQGPLALLALLRRGGARRTVHPLHARPTIHSLRRTAVMLAVSTTRPHHSKRVHACRGCSVPARTRPSSLAVARRQHRRLRLLPASSRTTAATAQAHRPTARPRSMPTIPHRRSQHLFFSERRRGSALGPNYSAREATLRNDYAQHYVDTHSLPRMRCAIRTPRRALTSTPN